MAFVDYGVSNKPSIHLNLDTTLNLKGNTLEFHWYVLTSTAVETLTHLCVVNHHAFCERHLLQDVLWFVPISFVFEILFDLFHYTTHRLLHSPYLYKYCHKTHHKFKHPTSIITFYQEPLDLIMTNSIPTLLTLTILAKYVSYRQFHMILIYKTFIEICGHCRKYATQLAVFLQFVWLPKWLHIELYTEDHDLHHSLNNCNYAKRFSLWDKVFHTYKPNEKN
jgi:sterol desaturase/sphingolipid hydroxylase (fatty acid hydroxylase superfamily)